MGFTKYIVVKKSVLLRKIKLKNLSLNKKVCEMNSKSEILICFLLLLSYLTNLNAQQISIGAELGPVKSYSKYTPSPSFYQAFEENTHNEGWVVSLYSRKRWVLTLTSTRFSPSSGIGVSERSGSIAVGFKNRITLLDRTWSFRVGKQWQMGESRLYVEPSLGMGFTNVKPANILPFFSDLLERTGHTYENGWHPNYQICLRAGLNFLKSSISLRTTILLGTDYYLTYHYLVKTEGMRRNVDISTRGDLVALQICYEYFFDLRRKR